MSYTKEEILKYQNERINQIRTNRYGDIGRVIGFKEGTCSYIIYLLNEKDQYETTWGNFNRGCFSAQYRLSRNHEKNINNQGSKMEIIEYRKSEDIDVKFESGYVAYHRTYDEFINGEIRDFYYPSIYGIGYIGVGNYNGKYTINGIKPWERWVGMLERCYSPHTEGKTKFYIDCTVTEEWYNFQNFANWCKDSTYIIPDEKLCLDKDILIKHNKLYHPDRCCFVPAEINSLFTRRERERGDLPIGVSLNRTTGKKYYATLSRKRLGKKCCYADTIEEAFAFYKREKEKYIKYVADFYKQYIPQKLYEAMYNYEVEITD